MAAEGFCRYGRRAANSPFFCQKSRVRVARRERLAPAEPPQIVPPAFLTKWGTNGTAEGQFDEPQGVAVDASGDVYVADRNNNRIQKFDEKGRFLTQWGAYGSGDGEFNFPYGVAIDGTGHIYVVDAANHRIQKFGGPWLDVFVGDQPTPGIR